MNAISMTAGRPRRPLKIVLWIVGACVVLPLPIVAYEFLASRIIGGMSEIEYLANLPGYQRQALYREMNEQVAAGEAHLQALAPQGDAVIAKDREAAYAVTQRFVRDLVGPTKILRFPSFPSAKVVAGKTGVFSVRSAVSWWEGKDYRPAPFEAVVVYQGQGVWKLDWLNIQRRKGKVRLGQTLTMPGFPAKEHP